MPADASDAGAAGLPDPRARFDLDFRVQRPPLDGTSTPIGAISYAILREYVRRHGLTVALANPADMEQSDAAQECLQECADALTEGDPWAVKLAVLYTMTRVRAVYHSQGAGDFFTPLPPARFHEGDTLRHAVDNAWMDVRVVRVFETVNQPTLMTANALRTWRLPYYEVGPLEPESGDLTHGPRLEEMLPKLRKTLRDPRSC